MVPLSKMLNRQFGRHIPIPQVGFCEEESRVDGRIFACHSRTEQLCLLSKLKVLLTGTPTLTGSMSCSTWL